MTSQEIYEAGYAIPVYSVSGNERWWRYKDQVFATPTNVETKEMFGLKVLEKKHHEPLHWEL